MTALLVVSAIEAVATAIWLLPASVHIVRWPAGGPERLAVIRPAWQLAALLAAGMACAALLLIAEASWRKRGRAGAASWLGRTGPISLLWLWAVPYLPWLPDRLPLLLVLVGPLRWVIAAAAAVALLWRWTWLRVRLSAVTLLSRRAVFATSVLVYLVVGIYAVRTNGLWGDAPHYLIITESLIRDGDLKIENNHQQRDYRSFFGGELRPDYMQRGRNGAIYSIHAPGLPLLLLPVYAVAGYLGAVAAMCLIAALAALAVFDLARAVAGQTPAVITWMAVCLTVPFVPHAWSIFPEMPGALVVAWAALWMWRPIERSIGVWMWRGAILGTLPWLHTKFAVFLAVFAAGLALRLLPRLPSLIAFAAPIAISGALWLYSFYAIYGVFDPEAPYGAYASAYVLTRNIPHGLLGIFFDQKFGLLFYNPTYLVSIAGAWLILRRPEHRLRAGVLLLAVVAFVGATARLYMFWGGSSAPARFLVPILPCLVPMIALALEAARSTMARALVGLWLAIGLALAAVGMAWPARLVLFSDPHGRSRILELLQAGSPLALAVPTFTEPDWAAQIGQLGAWLVAAAVGVGAALLVSRVRSRTVLSTACTACLAFLLAGSVVAAKPPERVRDETTRRGALDVLWRFDGLRFRTLDYQSLGSGTPERLRQLSTFRAPAGAVGESGYSTGLLNLPAGVYEAAVWFNGPRPREGEVRVATSSGTLFGQVAGRLDNPAVVRFELPVSVRRLAVRVADRAAAAAIDHIAIAAIAVVAPSERETLPVRTVEAIGGRPGAYLAYTDEHAYPEGGVFWSRGTAETTLLVAAAGASRATLNLSTGPMSGEVLVSVAGQTKTVTVAAGQPNAVSFDLPAGQRVVPVKVQSTVMFRPGEVDPSSADMRGLGCRVRMTLE